MLELEALTGWPEHSIHSAMVAIDRGGTGIALVVDEERKLLGTVIDDRDPLASCLPHGLWRAFAAPVSIWHNNGWPLSQQRRYASLAAGLGL